jgi:hypothetical protein
VPHWGHGYATEAARTVVALGFSLGLHRIEAWHPTRNPASGAVMTKLGMTREGVPRAAAKKWGRFEDVAMYGVLAGEFVQGGRATSEAVDCGDAGEVAAIGEILHRGSPGPLLLFRAPGPCCTASVSGPLAPGSPAARSRHA